MLKYHYNKTMVLNGITYVYYKGDWWEENIVSDYELYGSNASAEETLEDMFLDVAYENCVYLEPFHSSEHLVHYIRH